MELTFWEVDILGVDISGVDILGVDILRLTQRNKVRKSSDQTEDTLIGLASLNRVHHGSRRDF